MGGHSLLIAAVTSAACAFGIVHAAEPLDTVLAAFAANDAAAKNRSVLTVDLNGVVDEYVIERVKPDRLRVIRNAGTTDAQESVTIGPTMYVRQPSGWIAGAAVAPMTGVIPSMDELFRSSLSGLTKSAPSAAPTGAERFSGHLTWSNGAATNDGQIDIVIDAGTKMLRTVTFRGTCAMKPCRFNQVFSYDSRLTIVAPK